MSENNNNEKSYIGYTISMGIASILIGALIPFIISLIGYLISTSSSNEVYSKRTMAMLKGSVIGFCINLLVVSLIM